MNSIALSPGLTLDGSTTYTRASQWVVSNVRVFSPTKVNEARFGYNSLYNSIAQQLAGVLTQLDRKDEAAMVLQLAQARRQENAAKAGK